MAATTTGSQAFTYTGAQQTFTVPAGVTSVHVVVVGAKGGDTTPSSGSSGAGHGGWGAREEADLAVTPGQTLAVQVGQVGADGFPSCSGPTVSYHGGGAGGGSGGGCNNESGASGGGASEVEETSSPWARLVIAGGGGGAGGAGYFAQSNGQSGTFGGDAGISADQTGGGSNGASGTSSAGGAAGAANWSNPHAGSDTVSSSSDPTNCMGTDGRSLVGGDGGSTASGTDCTGGGGGGGGWYGGGGGGPGVWWNGSDGLYGSGTDNFHDAGGGGGSGSSGCPANSAVSNCTTPVVDQSDPPEVIISWGATAYNLAVTTGQGGGGSVTSSDSAINCGSSGNACSSSYGSGAQVTLTASPDPNYAFVGWVDYYGDPISGCSGTTCSVTMTQDRYVEADFAPLWTLTMQDPTPGGKVASDDGWIDCPGGACQATYVDGSQLHLTETPNPGWAFTGWLDGSGHALPGCAATSSSCAITMSSNLYVVADYAQLYTLTVQPNTASGGSVTSSDSPQTIDCGASCQASYVSGTPVTLTATPAAGYVFTGWNARECSGTGTCTVTMSADTYVGAAFTPAPPSDTGTTTTTTQTQTTSTSTTPTTASTAPATSTTSTTPSTAPTTASTAPTTSTTPATSTTKTTATRTSTRTQPGATGAVTLAGPAGAKWAKLYWHLPPGLVVKSRSATLVKAGVPLQVRGQRLSYSVTKVSKKGGELWLKLASPQKSMTISISSGFLTYNAQGLALLRAGTYQHGEVVPVVLKLTTTKGKTVTVQLRVALP